MFFDNASTTKVDIDIIEEISRINDEYFYNPGGLYSKGRHSKQFINNTRVSILDNLCGDADAKIIFTTHYVEILDYLNRRDNINILHKVDGKIFSSNLYINYKPRTEILKSKQFNSNTFNTLLNYELLMNMKRMIKDEISNND